MDLAQGLALSALIALLFYGSPWGLICSLAVVPFWHRMYMADKEAKARGKMLGEFKEYMMLISSSLQAGYSLERAIKQSEEEHRRLFFKESVLLPYIHEMNKKISLNTQVERAFDDFAKDIDIEEAKSLSEILSFSKRSGGDYGRHIRNTAVKIDEKIGVKQEIETITTEKRLELKVMCLMPMGILAYVALTSSDFIAPLYKNALGIAIMSVLLLVYGLMVELGQRIIKINV